MKAIVALTVCVGVFAGLAQADTENFDRGVPGKLPPGWSSAITGSGEARWHTLRVEFAGRRFNVSLNGRKLFDVDDATFGEAGKVGLWTKADSVMLFDDFSSGSK